MALNINTSLLLIVPFIFFAHSFLACTEEGEVAQEKKSPQKMSSGLLNVISHLESSSTTEDQKLSFINKSVRIDEEGMIQIYIMLYNIDETTLNDLKSHGLKIDIYDKEEKLVQGWALPNQIRDISKLPYVKFIDLPAYGVSH
jgi:hypothetical protein